MRNPFLHPMIIVALVSVSAVGAEVTEPGWSVEAVPTPGLSRPTTMQFLGPDDFFVLEKASGKVKRYTGGVASEVLDLPVNAESERGLLGIELHPDFPTTPSVYLYYSRADGGDGGSWTENRLSRFTWNGTSLTSETPLLSFPDDPPLDDGPNHDGGVLRFGPDGKLYGVTGDLNRRLAEQNNSSTPNTSAQVGGIFRINPDGSIPDDNPFTAEANTDFHKWFAYGVRNSFGMAFDPLTGTLWDTENGPREFDEINVVESGLNSGWKPLMGPEARSINDVGDLVMLDSAFYSDPEFSWQDPIGVAPIQFLAGSALGAAYDDAVLVGDVNTDQLYLFRLNDARDGFELSGDLADLVADSNAEADPLVVGDNFSNPVDMRIGPDGAVYVVSLFDGVYRVVPEPATLVLLTTGGLLVLRKRG